MKIAYGVGRLSGTLRPSFFLLLILAVLPPVSTPLAEQLPDTGAVSDNVYRNQFFGFTYQFPRGWLVKQAEGSPQLMATPSKPGVYPLFFAYEPPNYFQLGTVLIRAVKLSSPDANAKQFLLDEYPTLKGLGFNPGGEPKELAVGGWSFAIAISRKRVGGGTLHQESLVTIQKGYALEFNFIANQDATLKVLHNSMQSLELLRPISTPGELDKHGIRPGKVELPPPPTVESIEATGRISGNTYENGFFGFSYEFPKELIPESRTQAEQAARLGHEAIYGNEPANDPEHQAAGRHSIALLTLVGPRRATPSVPEQIMLLAEDVSAFPSISAKQCMMQLAGGMARNPLRFEQYRLAGEKRVGKIRFAKAEFRTKVEFQGKQFPMYVTYLGIVSKGYFLAWGFTAENEKNLRPLIATIDSVRLENPPEARAP